MADKKMCPLNGETCSADCAFYSPRAEDDPAFQRCVPVYALWRIAKALEMTLSVDVVSE